MPVHQCQFCPKKFQRSTKLSEHVRGAHTGERPFKCPTCEKLFVRSYDLTKHHEIHDGQPKYRCHVEEPGRTWGCGKAFYKKGDLVRHQNRAGAFVCRQSTPTTNEQAAHPSFHDGEDEVEEAETSKSRSLSEDRRDSLENSSNEPGTPGRLFSSSSTETRPSVQPEDLAQGHGRDLQWGGMSVQNALRDDMVMTGASPIAFQAPPYHSSTYLPKLEANFMNNFNCCGLTLPNLHDLLQHYEDVHAQKSSVGELHPALSIPQPTAGEAGISIGETDKSPNPTRATTETLSSEIPAQVQYVAFTDADDPDSDGSMDSTPKPGTSSPELSMRTYNEICGLFSTIEVASETPWQSLIWPLARDSSPLYHAILALIAFYGSHIISSLRLLGNSNKVRSVSGLFLDHSNMRSETRIATSLTLAFAARWDSGSSSDMLGLILPASIVQTAVVKYRTGMQSGTLTTRDEQLLRLLCNTFVYIYVMAGLTSKVIPEVLDLNLEEVMSTLNQPDERRLNLDPLLGSAFTLFPLLNSATELIRRSGWIQHESPARISQAIELSMRLQEWKAMDPTLFNRSDNSADEIRHSIQNAEAYRYATLLILHQAISEIPPLSKRDLPRTILIYLARVPERSKFVIVQLFPLLVAGCELTGQFGREWVLRRCEEIYRRLKVDAVRKCVQVLQEVWLRRDAFELKRKQAMRERESFARQTTSDGTENPRLNLNQGPFDSEQNARHTLHRHSNDKLESDFTVPGRLPWLSVMREWGWDPFLG